MGKNKRKRYFSLILVPDQDQNPKSLSMSYFMGKLTVLALAFLIIHTITGFYSYYRIFELNKTKEILAHENRELDAQNRKIEQIAKKHEENDAILRKMLKGLGATLGVETDMDLIPGSPVMDMPVSQPVSPSSVELLASGESSWENHHRLPMLRRGESDYFDPEHLPTFLPVEGYMTTRFQKGGWFAGRRHLGIDIAAERGTVIQAAGSGHVVFADWTPDFGNLIIIYHGNGLFTYYAHANYLISALGDFVKRGRTIALLGSSGMSSAPHLHFEIWKNGEAVNPEEFLIMQQTSGN
jgi:murein DD-endopeptidase MepM/ murein hydrolase activator NlpD